MFDEWYLPYMILLQVIKVLFTITSLLLPVSYSFVTLSYGCSFLQPMP